MAAQRVADQKMPLHRCTPGYNTFLLTQFISQQTSDACHRVYAIIKSPRRMISRASRSNRENNVGAALATAKVIVQTYRRSRRVADGKERRKNGMVNGSTCIIQQQCSWLIVATQSVYIIGKTYVRRCESRNSVVRHALDRFLNGLALAAQLRREKTGKLLN